MTFTAFPGHAGRAWPLPRWRSVARIVMLTSNVSSPTCVMQFDAALQFWGAAPGRWLGETA
jgi:hypothetical protein